MTLHDRLSLAAGPLVLSALLLGLAAEAQAQAAPAGLMSEVHQVGSAAVAPPEQTGAIHGLVVDAETGAPVGGAQIRLRDLGGGELSHEDGTFHFRRVPAGDHTVLVQRIGYAPAQRDVTVAAEDTARVTVELQPSALDLPGIVVTAAGREQSVSDVYQPTTVLDGAELRRQLRSSLAATLEDEPGISQRYNGPAASQPVIRGLSGDRVLVLEDGNRTGDVASTSGDHAVSIDPATAQRIEVVRGPAALLYGSNALGGVINVIRDDVPRTLPERLTGTLSLQAESVNEGLSGAGSVRGSLGSFAWQATGGGRRADDTRTPLGDLPFTSLTSYNANGGLSWIHADGYAGLSLRDYAIEYGVPGTFAGQTVPGAHEGGVTIDMRRVTGVGRGAWLRGVGPFDVVEADATYAWYLHREIEPGGVVGTEFGQISGSGRVVARHEHREGDLSSDGAIGVSAMGRDFSVAGSNTGSRPAQEITLAGFGYEEVAWEAFSLQFGGRYDWSRIEPEGPGPSPIGEIRPRSFGAISGSLAGVYRVRPGMNVGVSIARAFRTPSIEELYSDGPHLADFSFNIGNPDLAPEYGLGLDAFARLTLDRLQAEIGVYHNTISDFIFYAPTGETDPRFGRFPVFQAMQGDAVLRGAEAKAQWEALRYLVVHGQASYVHGERSRADEPLPAIPPLELAAGVRYTRSGWFAGLEWSGAAEQDRVAEFEIPTEGYSLLSLSAGLRWMQWGHLNSLALEVDNLTDEVWRDHLSRIRAVAPQPGRNIQLLYRINL